MSEPSLRPCPVCTSEGPRALVHRQRFQEGPLGEGYDVVVCAACGAGFADGIPTQAELDRYYEERSKYTYAHAAGAESPYDFKRFELIADQIEAHVPDKTARILDIGCATGGLLAVLQRRGYRNVLGSDPSATCAEAARRLYGIEVKTATLAQHAAWTERFDAVLLVGVLEHVREVRAAVQVVAGLLAPAGKFYCAQPDVEAFAECHNAPYQQFSTEHVNFFSRVSLGTVLASAGLTPKQVWRWPVEWREGMTDSVVSGVFGRAVGAIDHGRDAITQAALQRYVEHSAAQDARVLRVIEDLVRSQEPILIWGAGSFTRHLLASTPLGQANITVFVDSSLSLQAATLLGRSVLAPSALAARSETIVICSLVFGAEIRRCITAELRLPNRVRSIFSL
jgi:2-polyprenyl-3-methyl-5-hydroxy-6-metoxy-1,4-benzoquinol methylase